MALRSFGVLMGSWCVPSAVCIVWPAHGAAHCYREVLRGTAGPGGPSALGLHCQRANGLTCGTALLELAARYVMHPDCGLYPLCCPQALAVLRAAPKTLVDPSVERGRQP